MNRSWPMLIAVAALMSCASPGETKKPQPVAGSFGGNHAGLTLTAAGGTLTYDCAAGTIDEPVIPNKGGEFFARGTHTPLAGGPAQQVVEPPSYDASYQGEVTPQGMTLRVYVRSTGLVLGPFTLRKDASPLLTRCL